MMSGYELTELTESVAYDIAFGTTSIGTSFKPKMGFIIIRHVNNKQTDYYWKECYTCIRKWYTEPILIIDDSSHPEFLHDNMNLVNCQIVYDTEHKGCAELLGYYYFHLMKPFQMAVILHDSVFIQKRIEFITEVEKTKTFQPLWTFPKHWDHELESYYIELCKDMPMYGDMIRFYHSKNWEGCYGIMSIIHSNFIHTLEQYGLFTVMDKIQERRDARSAIERIMGFVAYYAGNAHPSMFGEIHSYTKWGTTFTEYLISPHDLPIVKVWTGR